MLVNSYFDETGTNVQSPVMAMAGWVIDSDQAETFDRSWREVLKKYGVREAKAARLAAALGGRKGEATDFDGWTHRRAGDYRQELNRVIDRNMRFGIFVAVDKTSWETVMGRYCERPSPLSDPYRWLMQTCLEYLILLELQPMRGRLCPQDRVTVMFDRGHPKRAVSEGYFKMVTSDPTYEIAQTGRIVGGYQVGDSLKTPVLQAADHLAWGAGRGMRRMLDGGGSGPIITEGIFGMRLVKTVGGLWDAESLLKSRRRHLGL